ncbi:MAG: hypothetical protein GY792_00830 [Gammaproteobacteria bacterium]|nr:hypothetical protein [Gammaproteobacteria bacterium]
MIEKSGSNQPSLATAPIPGQAPRLNGCLKNRGPFLTKRQTKPDQCRTEKEREPEPNRNALIRL